MMPINETQNTDRPVAQAATPPRILLLTGAPGSGKTTVLHKVAEALAPARLCGFYTEESREQGIRRGFRLVSFDGREGVIAHVACRGQPRVGKYGVNVAVLDRLARISLAPREDCALYLVDEIGRMECLAPGFIAAIRTLFQARQPLMATIALKGGGFIEEVKTRGDVELWEVTRANRDRLPAEILAWLDAQGVTDRLTSRPPGRGRLG